jgi:hypothetical protein
VHDRNFVAQLKTQKNQVKSSSDQERLSLVGILFRRVRRSYKRRHAVQKFNTPCCGRCEKHSNPSPRSFPTPGFVRTPRGKPQRFTASAMRKNSARDSRSRDVVVAIREGCLGVLRIYYLFCAYFQTDDNIRKIKRL